MKKLNMNKLSIRAAALGYRLRKHDGFFYLFSDAEELISSSLEGVAWELGLIEQQVPPADADGSDFLRNFVRHSLRH
jgi:hypothetical protein